MINDGINNVPDKTIAIFRHFDYKDKIKKYSEKNQIDNILKKSTKKRGWFKPHFYRCLPLVIGNTYGFTIESEFDITFNWDGGSDNQSVKFKYGPDAKNKYPLITSHFGDGIITIKTPFSLRTPPGINIMTINPPNHIIPNITVLTGVIETDNLRRDFTFNLKIQIPNIEVFIPAGTPLAGFIPIPRYYADSFELKYADEIFDQNIIEEEGMQVEKFAKIRVSLINEDRHEDSLYMKGMDADGNKFNDHQRK